MTAAGPVNIVVAPTDNDWFSFLRKQRDLELVNFWSPSSRGFRALGRGELFLFKRKAPVNKIGGGGIFLRSCSLPTPIAWDCFGVSNGAPSLEQLHSGLQRYQDPGAGRSLDIGCRVLVEPFFFDEDDLMDLPRDWPSNIQGYKKYSTQDAIGRRLWEEVAQRIVDMKPKDKRLAEEQYQRPQPIKPLLGPQAFRFELLDIYDYRCSVTDDSTVPALAATHIYPHSLGGRNETSNGLALRSDLQSLFDKGYVTVTDDLHFKVSGKIKDVSDDESKYFELSGRRVRLPAGEQPPYDKALQWHYNNRFLG